MSKHTGQIVQTTVTVLSKTGVVGDGGDKTGSRRPEGKQTEGTVVRLDPVLVASRSSL